MKGITIKLPEDTLQALAAEARASGRSIAAVVRSRLDAPQRAADGSVYAQARDLAGVLAEQPQACKQRSPQVPARMIHICDTGPLIAFLNRNDPYHAWAVGLMQQVPAPLLSSAKPC